jgi:serine/threonine protein kinase
MTDETTEHWEAQATLKPGTVLNDKYELLEQIGRGGMGVVWKAHDRVADRLVALKFVPNDLKRYEEEMQRMKAAFQKVHALHHQTICPVHSLEDGGTLGYWGARSRCVVNGSCKDTGCWQRKSTPLSFCPGISESVGLMPFFRMLYRNTCARIRYKNRGIIKIGHIFMHPVRCLALPYCMDYCMEFCNGIGFSKLLPAACA